MKIKYLIFLSIALGVGALGQDVIPPTGPVNVRSVDFKFSPDRSRLEISMDNATGFVKNVSEADRQVIIEIQNAQIPAEYARKLDTSNFKSNVAIISPYQSGDNVRVVLQLKNNGGVDVTQEGNKLVAFIDNGTGGEAAPAPLPATPPDAATAALLPPADNTAPPPAGANAQPPGNGQAQSPQPGQDNLDSFFQAQQTNQYAGKKIGLQLREADMIDVFRVISEASEFNIILGDEVKGKLTINLVDVPWDQALDMILHSQKLAAERSGNILRVTTVDSLTKEKEAQVIAARAAESAEPLVVKIFPISYAKIDDIKKIVDDFLSKDTSVTPGSAGFQPVPPKRGSTQIDTRTNSLVVRDTAATIEKIKRIIQELDTQTPQVLIEAKFVQVTEGSSKDIEGRIFLSSREFDAGLQQLAFSPSVNNYGAMFAGSQFGNQTLPTSFAVSPVPGASFGFQPRTGLIPGLSEIGALLSILETEQQAKIIASPRVVTQNKEPAEISQGQTIQLPTTAGANAAGSFITVNAVLKLTVTPQVTNEGTITLKINFSQDSISAQQLGTDKLTTDTKKVDTTVLIDSGATLVIGGVYSNTVNHSEAGIPILRDLPLLGPFFGSKFTTTQKGELFIFLTPRLLNEKESGLRG